MQDQNPALMDENPCGSDYENDISMYLDDSPSCNINSDGVADGVALENYYVEAYPVGLRFSPTDPEVIYYYLKNKVENRPLPPVNIEEVDIYKFNPEDLAKRYQPNCDRPKVWYFFTPRDRKYRNGKRPNRTAGDGFWRATGADKEVKMNGKVIGWKRALVFYCGKPRKGAKTSWIMHEYMLKDAHPSSTTDTSSSDMQLDVCVLCKIYKNTRKSDIVQEQNTSQNHTLYTSQNQISPSYQYMQLGAQATSVNSFQNQPSSSYQGMQLGVQSQPFSSHQHQQLGVQVTSTENNFQSQPSSSCQYQQLGGQQEPHINNFQSQPSSSHQYQQLGVQAVSTENNFQSQPSSSHQYPQLGGQQEPHINNFQSQPFLSYQYQQLGDQQEPYINNFQNQPSSSHQYQQLVGQQEPHINNFQSQPSSSHQYQQLGVQATSTENNFQSQPSSSLQFQQLGGQQEPHTTISYSSVMTTYDPMIDNTINYIQTGYLNPTPLHCFPSAFDPQEYYVNTAMINNVNNVLFP